MIRLPPVFVRLPPVFVRLPLVFTRLPLLNIDLPPVFVRLPPVFTRLPTVGVEKSRNLPECCSALLLRPVENAVLPVRCAGEPLLLASDPKPNLLRAVDPGEETDPVGDTK